MPTCLLLLIKLPWRPCSQILLGLSLSLGHGRLSVAGLFISFILTTHPQPQPLQTHLPVEGPQVGISCLIPQTEEGGFQASLLVTALLCKRCFKGASVGLTLPCLSLGDPLADNPAGIIDCSGGFKLHRLHHIALADTDFQRQGNHGAGSLGGLLSHLQKKQRKTLDEHGGKNHKTFSCL